MSTHLPRWSVALLLAGLMPAIALGQPNRPKSEFQAGDKVVIGLLGDQEAEVVSVALDGWPIVKFPFGGKSSEAAVPPEHLRRADKAAAADPNAAPVKRPVQPGDIVTLKDGTKGYLTGFDDSGHVLLQVERGRLRVPFPHFAKLDKVVSIEPNPRTVDPRREKRVWTDITGKHKTQATFLRVHDGKVELKKADGIAKVPLDKLSAADRKIAEALAQEDELAQLRESLLAGRIPDRRELGPFQNEAADITTIEANRTECREVVLDDKAPAGGLTPDPALAQPAALTERPIVIPPLKTDVGRVAEHPIQLFFATAKGQALVTFQVNDNGRQRKRLVRCDLVGGEVVESLELPQATLPLDVDAEGQVLVGRGESFAHGRLDYFALSAGEAKRIASWQPSDMVGHAALIDKDHVLTVDQAGRLTVWKAAEAKALYTLAMDQGTVPAVSGGGKYLAVAAPVGTVYILEALTGKPLVKLAGDLISAPQLSFRPDGKYLAAVRHGTARVWDVASGKLEHELKVFPAHNPGRNYPLAWPAEGFLLGDGENLLDLKRGILLWHYRIGIGSTWQGVFGGRYWNAQRTQSGHALAFTPIPHPQAAAAAAGLDAEELLAVKPGLEVAVDVRVTLPAEQQRALYDSLVKRLTDNGLKVVPRASLVLHCATGSGPAQEVEYRRTDRPNRPGEKVTVGNTTSSLWFSENGKWVWVASRTFSAPGEVRLDNKDLRTAVAEQMGPDTEFFLKTPLPSRVPRPGNDPSGAYGSSVLEKLTGE